MSTIGHPLADLTNLLTPFTTAENTVAREMLQAVGRADESFLPGKTPGLPSRQQCLQWYNATAGWEFSTQEYAWGDAFNIFKGAIIMQGIAARQAVRQASSANAHMYAAMLGPYGQVADSLVNAAISETKKQQSKSRL